MTTFYSSPGFVHKTMAGPAAWFKNIVIILCAVVNREPALLLISLNIM